jgi:hypothetical protein
VNPGSERLSVRRWVQKLLLLLVRRYRPARLVDVGKHLGWKVVYRRAFPRNPVGFTRDDAEAELATRRGFMLGRAEFRRGFNGSPRENWRASFLVPTED